ncbi:hypothetical protein BUALT_Bualt02G0081700 [Buddleja alternifolia]|uniref:UBC core domain-containing protein n=1 Tax=Buddleja alternifolia TaxID=168488 RepID=A0AAV6XYY5_9LAMI|nr:hypothetical protein BUALT_Bualt02G0081700 [Buddleja alternifolia]
MTSFGLTILHSTAMAVWHHFFFPLRYHILHKLLWFFTAYPKTGFCEKCGTGGGRRNDATQDMARTMQNWPVNNDDFHWEARMMGPMNSPYADHFFKLIIRFGPNFPLSPPMVNFRTKVFHPNISIIGGIELDILRERWNPALTIPKVLQRIRQLMAEPNVNCPHPSSTQALQLYLDNHNRYNGILGNEILEILECSDTGKRDIGCRDTGMRMNFSKHS